MDINLEAIAKSAPADSFARVAAALASLHSAELALSKVRTQSLKILEGTLARLNAFNKAIATTARVANANERRAVSAQPAAAHPNAPTNQQIGVKFDGAAMASAAASSIESAFQRATSAVSGFVAAASPSHFSTLQASITLLSMEIGELFLPYVEYASAAIQSAARWFSALDDGTKVLIGRMGAAAIAFGGVIVIGRQLYNMAILARGALVALSLATAATPLGAIIAATTAVAGLAAAWWAVSKAAEGANGVMGGARGPVAGPATRNTEFTPSEIDAMPAPYGERYRELQVREANASRYEQLPAGQQRDVVRSSMPPADVTRFHAENAPGTISEGWRASLMRAIQRDRETLVTQFTQDFAAQGALLGSERPRFDTGSTEDKRRAVSTAADTARKDAAAIRGTLPALGSATPAAQLAAAKKVEDISWDKATLGEYATAERAIASAAIDREKAAAKAAGRPARSNQDVLQSPEVQDAEKEALTDIIFRRLRESKTLSEPEIQNIPRSAVKSSLERIGTTSEVVLTAKGLAPRLGQIVPETLRKAETLEGRGALLDRLSSLIGATPGEQKGFLQNIKSPIQARMTDLSSYAESVQLKALNEGDADAEILRKQLEILNKLSGNAEKLIEAYLNRSQGSTPNWLQGFIDLGR